MMKKLVLGFLATLIFTFSVTAQESPTRALKKAGSALTTYELDQSSNMDKLHEAVDLIGLAVSSDETNENPVTWQTQGNIYNTIANAIATTRATGFGDLADLPQVENPALTALNGYLNAHSKAVKKFQTKDALKGLTEVQNSLNNMGIYAYELGEYETAYLHFDGVVKAHDVLSSAGEASILDEEGQLEEQLYITGLAALNGEKVTEAGAIFTKLTGMGYEKAAIYEAQYKIEVAGADDLSDDEATARYEAAYAHLEQGRTAFPDDISLLFAEINHFLRINKLEVLIEKLESAIDKEPENVSLYSTTGNVYDQLYQRETEAGNVDAATTYFDKALEYYGQALQKDAGFTDATYSIGALYFNKAANMTKELSVLADDFSKEGQNKYDALKLDVEAEFDKALPYFMDVEKANPNDMNTLIALKEIMARKNDFEKSNEFKDRIERAQNGEKLESFFENN